MGADSGDEIRDRLSAQYFGGWKSSDLIRRQRVGVSNLDNSIVPSQAFVKKPAFLTGVFLITFSVLVFQIVQTRILSVITWYYLAFFAISVAMLGMTIGAVWVYLQRDRFLPDRLASDLSRYSLATAFSIPASMMVQFSLITTLSDCIDHRLLGPAAGGDGGPLRLCWCSGEPIVRPPFPFQPLPSTPRTNRFYRLLEN